MRTGAKALKKYICNTDANGTGNARTVAYMSRPDKVSMLEIGGDEDMSGVTPDQLMTTAYVLLAVFAAIVTVDKVIDIVKKWRSPATDVASKLANDKQRLDEHEKALANLQESTEVFCSGILALLDHELHNGNADQMQQARDQLVMYLSRKLRN